MKKSLLPVLGFIMLFGSGCWLTNGKMERVNPLPTTPTTTTNTSPTTTTSTVKTKPVTKPVTPVVGKTTVLKVGQYFTASFPTNPSTGYTWQIDQKPLGIVTVTDGGVSYPKNKGYGSEGTGSWVIKAAKVGKTTVTFKYVRSWEYTTEPAKVHTYNIVVQ
jgi:inhibitor of cysteine peptidase